MQTFNKEERLSGKILIDQLFKKGDAFTVHPFKVFWMEQTFESKYPVQVIISVPVKHFKKATERNQIRRYIKEAYRLNKKELYVELKQLKKNIILGLIYIDKNKHPYTWTEAKIILTLHRLQQEIAD